MLWEGDLEFENPNSLLANPVDAILPGLGVGTFYEPVGTEYFERAAYVRQAYARRFRYASGRFRSMI